MVRTTGLCTGALFHNLLVVGGPWLTTNQKKCLGSYLYYTRALANVSKLGKRSLCLVGLENRPLKSKKKSIIRLEILRVSARVFWRIRILCPCDRNNHDSSNFDSREKKVYYSNCLFLLFYRTLKFKACFLGHCFFLWSILFCRCKA